MSDRLNNFRVPTVGAGWAGFLAVETLETAAPGVAITLVDRFPAPWAGTRRLDLA